MMKFLQIFFTTLGVVFFLIIIGGAYLYIADPFEIKPLIKILTSKPATEVSDTKTSGTKSPAETIDKNPLLNTQQEKAVESLGLDPAALPSEITPAMEQCFYENLGAERANEIKAGAEPTAADYFKARTCLQ